MADIITVTRKDPMLLAKETPCIQIIPSKSAAHRVLMMAALSAQTAKTPIFIACSAVNADMEATADCLCALGADIQRSTEGFFVTPLLMQPSLENACTEEVDLYVGESGSTLRFLLPILGALGRPAAIHMEGRLPQRPLAPLDTVLIAHGMQFRREQDDSKILHVSGNLTGTCYEIDGGISSQYITGLLIALSLCRESAALLVHGTVSSAPYIQMTTHTLRSFSVLWTETAEVDAFGQTIHRYEKADGAICAAAQYTVEGDWSSAAAMLCIGALSRYGYTVNGVRADSLQGDRRIVELLGTMGARTIVREDSVTVLPPEHSCLQAISFCAEDVPDLVPVLAVICGAAAGRSVITGCHRLRIKESDRLSAVAALLAAIGVCVEITEDDTLHIYGRGETDLMVFDHETEITVPACADHRMVMAAAAAACYTASPIRIPCAESVKKSYPHFFEDLSNYCICQKEEEPVCPA